jgi:lysophospholipase L1-like esterase
VNKAFDISEGFPPEQSDFPIPAYEFLRPLMRSWYAMKMGESGIVPKPNDSTSILVEHADPDRVLLLGNGPTHGWGVSTHELALAGQLSRSLGAFGSRPSSVDYIGDETMNIRSARAWVGERDLSRYDLITVVIGMNDAVRLTETTVWEREMRNLILELTAGAKDTVRLLVAGIQPVRSVSAWNEPFGTVAEWHARRLNAITERIVAEVPTARYFRLRSPNLEADRPHGSAAVYRSWANDLAIHATPLLESVRESERKMRMMRMMAQPEVSEWEWSGAENLVDAAALGGTAELQRLATLAQETFEVDVAVVSLLNGDRLWYAMNTDRLPTSIPREIAYCNLVVNEQQQLIVPDARRDDRFRDNPFIDITGKIFYAGHPLVASTGETIGTFCLLNSKAKSAASVPLDQLRDIALMAQTELWKFESASISPAL